MWEALSSGTSGVRELTLVPTDAFPMRFGAEARDFTGAIEDFGPLDKGMSRNIKKNLKVMCREMQIGIAAAQLALSDCKLPLGSVNLDRVGCIYGSDYMLTLPQEFTAGMRNCLDERGKFDFRQWAEKGLPAVEPLWLRRALPRSNSAVYSACAPSYVSMNLPSAFLMLVVASVGSGAIGGYIPPSPLYASSAVRIDSRSRWLRVLAADLRA